MLPPIEIPRREGEGDERTEHRDASPGFLPTAASPAPRDGSEEPETHMQARPRSFDASLRALSSDRALAAEIASSRGRAN